MFIIAALIFALLLYTLVIKYNEITTYPTPQEFQQQKDAYQKEFPKVINFAIYNSSDINSQLDNFTNVFLGEARKKDPNFGILYLYKDTSENVHIVNTLTEKVLTIKLTNIDASQLNLNVVGKSGSEGQICISGVGVGCTTSTVDQSQFGSGFDNKETLSGVQFIELSVSGLTTFPIPLDVQNFTSLNLIQSQQILSPQNIPGTSAQVEVTLNQY